MRTTLDIEADILAVAKDIAASERSTAGAVLSKLARAGYHASGTQSSGENNLRNGIEMLPKRQEPTSLSHPGYSKKLQLPPGEVIRRLDNFLAKQQHRFWEDHLSLRK